jgi:L-fucose isomerase-like protein
MKKTTFALYFGNRGFFPETLIAGARRDMVETLDKFGYDTLIMDENATPYGAVESPEDGEKYARFLNNNRGKYDGVILCLPNFGDETGAISALEDAGVPIMIQAYPDELDKMGFDNRRDAFCGKFSIMDVFYQYGLPFTTYKPHTVHPASETFTQHLKQFAAVCRVVNGMKKMIVGAIGARTTAFKTVRFDELSLQKYGITTETLDLSEVILRVRDLKTNGDKYRIKAEQLKKYTNWDNVPDEAFTTLTKLSLVLDDIVTEYNMDAMALRCWIEIEKELKVSPCVILSEMNERGITAACELDVCNAIAMYGLSLASDQASACLDWNNNYGEDENKCILFHCGPVAHSLMTEKGTVIEHPMFAKALGPGCSYGCNVGRIASGPMTFSSTKTQDGELIFYIGEGKFTKDKIADDFFGCAGVAEIMDLQDKLKVIGHQGYRHHVSVTSGYVGDSVREAWKNYLNYQICKI